MRGRHCCAGQLRAVPLSIDTFSAVAPCTSQALGLMACGPAMQTFANAISTYGNWQWHLDLHNCCRSFCASCVCRQNI